MPEYKYTNRLINEKSPYLLQHAHNPVDWYPWGEEAFQKAKKEEKPIFLSVGYSTCHWCHVMEKESFEDEQVAEVLNRDFVSIKVDREERPDIDTIYMAFCQVLTGRGGWPLTVILTPDKKPFFAGTYMPKLPKYDHPGLLYLLDQFTASWRNQRQELFESGRVIEEALKKAAETGRSGIITADTADRAYRQLEEAFDPEWGGFGRKPKFPSPHNLFFLLRYYLTSGSSKALAMVEKTLDGMYQGGLFDHIGFGFCRYATDERWLVPHFEKMLYDNAILAMAYTEAFAVTGNEQYKNVADRIFAYVLRDMANPDGGFYSAEDADSEGGEGRFYLFRPDEINEVLGEDAEFFRYHYDITEQGNFEGASIPNLIGSGDDGIRRDIAMSEKVDACRLKVLEYRSRRARPFRDDKILTSWNGLMIAALAFSGRITGDGAHIAEAEKAAHFIISRLTGKNRRLLARFRDGEAAIPGYLDDYAFMIWGLVELYEATLKEEWLEKASVWARDMIRIFWDEENGGFYFSGKDAEELILRPKEIYDGAMPSGNSVAAQTLLRLAALTEDEYFIETAQALLRAFGAEISKNPAAHIHLVSSYLGMQTGITSILISGNRDEPEAKCMLNVLQSGFFPFAAYRHEDGNEKDPTVALICRNNVCRAPVTDCKKFKKMLNSKY